MWEHKENDNLDMEEIERYMRMPQEERDKLMEKMEREIKEEIEQSRKQK